MGKVELAWQDSSLVLFDGDCFAGRKGSRAVRINREQFLAAAAILTAACVGCKGSAANASIHQDQPSGGGESRAQGQNAPGNANAPGGPFGRGNSISFGANPVPGQPAGTVGVSGGNTATATPTTQSAVKASGPSGEGAVHPTVAPAAEGRVPPPAPAAEGHPKPAHK